MNHRVRLTLLGCLFTLLLSSGCASSVGTRSTWELWTAGTQDGVRGLKESVRLLEGFNTWSDVGNSGWLISKGPQGGVGIATHDFMRTVIGPYSFEEFMETFDLLR